MHCLIRCLFVFCLLFLFACQKEQSRKQDRLVSFKDANRKYSVHYYGNQVSEIRVDSGLGAPFIIAKYSYQDNYIKATLHPSTGYDYVEYFMRKKVLPLSIIKHKNIGGRDTIVSRTDFYYSSGKDVPDSVVLRNTLKYNFMPVYNGGNISDYHLSQNNNPSILSGSFLYYKETNVFRSTNPLLFIYSSPVFEFETFLMPRIFSHQTMKKFNGGSFTYDTDHKGNLAVEDYGALYPYRRTYLYE